MRRAGLHGVLTCGLRALAACSPQPRAPSYFKAHPTEISKILAGCAAGGHRGAECVNAPDAAAQIRSDQRIKDYKQSFAP